LPRVMSRKKSARREKREACKENMRLGELAEDFCGRKKRSARLLRTFAGNKNDGQDCSGLLRCAEVSSEAAEDFRATQIRRAGLPRAFFARGNAGQASRGLFRRAESWGNVDGDLLAVPKRPAAALGTFLSRGIVGAGRWGDISRGGIVRHGCLLIFQDQ